jgi:hypothetical protein
MKFISTVSCHSHVHYSSNCQSQNRHELHCIQSQNCEQNNRKSSRAVVVSDQRFIYSTLLFPALTFCWSVSEYREYGAEMPFCRWGWRQSVHPDDERREPLLGGVRGTQLFQARHQAWWSVPLRLSSFPTPSAEPTTTSAAGAGLLFTHKVKDRFREGSTERCRVYNLRILPETS